MHRIYATKEPFLVDTRISDGQLTRKNGALFLTMLRMRTSDSQSINDRYRPSDVSDAVRGRILAGGA